MIRAFQLLLSPFETWEKIVIANRGALFVLLASLLPLLAISSLVEGYGLVTWGDQRTFRVVTISPHLAVRYELAHAALDTVAVLLGVLMLRSISSSFNFQPAIGPCMTVMVFGYSPVLLLRCLDALPRIPTWLCWGVGAMLSTVVLYHGVGAVLRPEQTKGFGLYMLTCIVVIVASALSHLLSLAVLHQKLFAGF